MSTIVLPRPEIDYPCSDGQPMTENDWQLHAMLYAIGALQAHFAHRPDVYVSGDTLVCYEEGDIGKSVAPDVFVVLGAPAHKRMVYKLWEEPKAPDFVLEVASPGTWRDDEGRKGELYARLGVREYWQYDPMGGLLAVRLRGRRLVDGGVYEAQPVVEGLDGTLMLRNGTLGLDLLAGRGGGAALPRPVHGTAAARPRRDVGGAAVGRVADRARGRRPPCGQGADRGAGGAPSRQVRLTVSMDIQARGRRPVTLREGRDTSWSRGLTTNPGRGSHGEATRRRTAVFSNPES